MTIRRSPIAVCAALLLLVVVPARASGTLRPDQAEYRELFRELVETNTTLSSGNCTTCVATMLDGGHARNALPQRARANVNCQIYPDQTFEDVRQELARTSSIPTSAVATASTNGFARVRCTRAATSFMNS